MLSIEMATVMRNWVCLLDLGALFLVVCNLLVGLSFL